MCWSLLGWQKCLQLYEELHGSFFHTEATCLTEDKAAETATSSANKGMAVVAAKREARAVWCTDTRDSPVLPYVWGCGGCCRLTLTATAKTWADKIESSSYSSIFAMFLDLNGDCLQQAFHKVEMPYSSSLLYSQYWVGAWTQNGPRLEHQRFPQPAATVLL